MNSSEVQALKVGDEVAYGRFGRYDYHSTGFAKVVKVNAHGHITLDNGMVFDKHGQERNQPFGVKLLDPNHLRERQERTKAQQETDRKVHEILGVLNDRRGGTGHYLINAETKEQLLKLVNQL